MTKQRVVLVTANEAAYWFMRTHRVMLKPGLVRLWAHRGKIAHHGGKKPFDLNEIERFARSRGLLAEC